MFDYTTFFKNNLIFLNKIKQFKNKKKYLQIKVLKIFFYMIFYLIIIIYWLKNHILLEKFIISFSVNFISIFDNNCIHLSIINKYSNKIKK